MEKNVIFWTIVVVMSIGLVLGSMYFLRFFSAATLHTQVINPKPGIECVVVSATDSTSVDCWKNYNEAVMRPGNGWTRLSGPVWEHKTSAFQHL